MTKITTLLFALTIQVAVSANANDSLRHCYQQLDIANSGIQTLKTENRELKAKIRTLNKTIDMDIRLTYEDYNIFYAMF